MCQVLKKTPLRLSTVKLSTHVPRPRASNPVKGNNKHILWSSFLLLYVFDMQMLNVGVVLKCLKRWKSCFQRRFDEVLVCVMHVSCLSYTFRRIKL